MRSRGIPPRRFSRSARVLMEGEIAGMSVVRPPVRSDCSPISLPLLRLQPFDLNVAELHRVAVAAKAEVARRAVLARMGPVILELGHLAQVSVQNTSAV